MGSKFKILFAVVNISIAVALSGGADAAKKQKKPGSRSDYSVAQQKAFFDEALKLCRKKFGPNVVRVKVDYRRKQYACWYQ